ncbi:MAG: hypothetical protein K8U57_29230 [Planctomycetes bacterium]|nr:hypothetical protein [Planctomycetota bacterium]
MPDFDEDNPRLPVEELKRIAGYQRWVIACVLAQVTMWLGILVMNVADGDLVELDIPVLVTCLLGGVGGIFAFLIYQAIRDPLWAGVMGLAVIVPAVGVFLLPSLSWLTVLLPVMSLLALTVVTSATTQVLNRNGVKIGLFGADLNEIKESFEYEDDGEDPGW